MDGGKVARYTKEDAPGDFPLITDLYAPKEYYEDNDDPAGPLPGWFLSALVSSGTTFATICCAFNQLPHDNWGFVAEVDCYWAMDEQVQMLATQIDLLKQEHQMAHTKWGLSRGRLEAAWADQHVCHLWLGQTGAQQEQNRVRNDLVCWGFQSVHG